MYIYSKCRVLFNCEAWKTLLPRLEIRQRYPLFSFYVMLYEAVNQYSFEEKKTTSCEDEITTKLENPKISD